MWEGFSDLGNAIRRVLFGYDVENNQADKEAKENLEKATQNVQENIDRNGYYNPMEAMSGVNISQNGLLIVAGILLVLMVFKD
jgi:hypothetical protein